jgi:hypothetical protein
MKYGFIGKKKMSFMPKWLENLRNLVFSFVVFVLVFAIIWVFYVVLEISHL